jgi:hypothetical protein
MAWSMKWLAMRSRVGHEHLDDVTSVPHRLF